jgi:hypothetical protein
VLLDAAVFAAGPTPPARAFTTDGGIGFQVLAGGNAGPAPGGPCAVALARVSLAAAAETEVAGVALLYAESGSGVAAGVAGAVRYARAAAQAPGSTAGPWRPLPPGAEAPLTAGSALLLGRDDHARVGNPGNRPLRLLMLTVRAAVASALPRMSQFPEPPAAGEPGG